MSSSIVCSHSVVKIVSLALSLGPRLWLIQNRSRSHTLIRFVSDLITANLGSTDRLALFLCVLHPFHRGDGVVGGRVGRGSYDGQTD